MIYTTLRSCFWQSILALVRLHRRTWAAVVRSQHLVQALTDAVVREDAVSHLSQYQERVNRRGPPTMSQTGLFARRWLTCPQPPRAQHVDSTMQLGFSSAPHAVPYKMLHCRNAASVMQPIANHA